jgi:hypothetical protein
MKILMTTVSRKAILLIQITRYIQFQCVANTNMAPLKSIGFWTDLMKDETSCNSNFDKLDYKIGLLRGTIYTKTLYLSPEYKLTHQ